MSDNYPVPYGHSALPYATPVAVPPAGSLVPASVARSDDTCSALIQLTTVGAVVGAALSAGGNLRQVQQGRIGVPEAVADTARATVTAAAATAIAGAAAGAVGSGGLTRLAVLLAVGTAVVYGIRRRAEGDAP